MSTIMRLHFYSFIFVLMFVAGCCHGDGGHPSILPTEREVILENFYRQSLSDAKDETQVEQRLADLRRFTKDLKSPGKDFDEFLLALKRAAVNAKRKEYNFGTAGGDRANMDQCLEAIDIVSRDAAQFQLYALKMFDAWAVPESGILEGNVRWSGHFRECRSARNRTIRGRWCNSFLGFRYEPYPVGYPIDITLASCFPDVCSEDSVRAILEEFYGLPNFLQHVNCPETEIRQLSTASIVGVCVGAFFLTLVAIGTAVDGFLRVKTKTNDQVTPEQMSKSTGVKIMLCFSAVSNGKKILDLKKRPGTIPTLDGMRVFSMTWVVMGHGYMMFMYGIDNLSQVRRIVENSPTLMPIINGVYSVDTFFFLSGLLVAYLGIKHLNKTHGHINIPLMYLQRYLRLTPAYAFGILFSVGLYYYCGSGPYWERVADGTISQCQDYWYSNLLYINNFYPTTNYCYAIGWYLACDMQFYILSPIFLLALYKSKLVGTVLSVFIIMSCMLITGLLTYFSNLQPIPVYFGLQTSVFLINSSATFELSYSDKFQTDTYALPWCRIAVYIIGMLTGYIIYEYKGKIKMHWAFVLFGWVTAGVISCAIMYGLWPQVRDRTLLSAGLSTFFETFARPMWAVCLSWVVIACVSGYGGPITSFLDWSAFAPLSRLTYSAYITHFLVLTWFVAIQETPLHFSTVNVVFFYLGTLVIAFGTGFILAVCVEWPMMGLLKLAFPPGKPKPVTKPNSNGYSHHDIEHVTKNGTTNLANGFPAKLSKSHENGGYLPEEEPTKQTSL